MANSAFPIPNPIAGSGTSLTDTITQTSHGFSVGQLVYLNSGAYTLALATTIAAAEVVGIVSAVADANTFTLTTSGHVTGLTALTAGSVYWLSDITPGLLTITVPTTVGNIQKPLFIADSSTGGYFINYRGDLIVAPPANGTVTSVNMSISPAASGSVSGGPITSTGTFALLLTGSFIRVLNLTIGTALTYTPSAGTRLIYVEMVGSGGSGGSINATGAQSAGGGGGAGGYCCKIISPLVASYTYTVGGAPSPASPGNNPGNPGSASTFTDGAATNMSAGGGLGGSGSGNLSVAYASNAAGGAGGTSTGGDLNFSGAAGLPGIVSTTAGAISGSGGTSFFSGGGQSRIQGAVGQQTGLPGVASSGSGGSGGASNGLSTNDSGGTGGSGLIRIWEYT